MKMDGQTEGQTNQSKPPDGRTKGGRLQVSEGCRVAWHVIVVVILVSKFTENFRNVLIIV